MPDTKSIMYLEDINDIYYTQNSLLKINIGSLYLEGSIEINISNNNYEKIFVKKAGSIVTQEFDGLDVGKYFVSVKYYNDEGISLIVFYENFISYKL